MSEHADPCRHHWRMPYPTMDFGRYGISYPECSVCGRTEESDPDTGEWKECKRVVAAQPEGAGS